MLITMQTFAALTALGAAALRGQAGTSRRPGRAPGRHGAHSTSPQAHAERAGAGGPRVPAAARAAAREAARAQHAQQPAAGAQAGGASAGGAGPLHAREERRARGRQQAAQRRHADRGACCVQRGAPRTARARARAGVCAANASGAARHSRLCPVPVCCGRSAVCPARRTRARAIYPSVRPPP